MAGHPRADLGSFWLSRAARLLFAEGMKREMKMGLFGNFTFLGSWRVFFSALAVHGE